MSPLPPLSAIRVFEAAARLENFTAAAQELGMTQAAVSYQVKLLEERLGISLFQRTGRKVALTEKGREIAPILTRAFDQMRQGFAALTQDHSAVLSISCTNSFAHLWLAPRIGAFQMRHPNLAVRIMADDAVVDLARDGIDLAVRGGKGEWPGLEAKLLTHNRLVPMCSPAWRDRYGPIADAQALHALPRLSPDDMWWHEWFAAMGVEADPADGPPGIALDSQVMEGRAAIAGQGVAILNHFLWRAEVEAGQLVEAVPSYVREIASYWLVYPPHARNTPKIKAFRDWISAEFASAIAADPDARFLPR
ncbi:MULTISPECIES: LysR substrate-binding domain-containing protein [Sphingobium]|jgi:LysR family glycine cleavage system transcriptional activator|uniref:LysR substrate-binding domain-containing protein n=1 Tax=Sphingobium TaxID=165695 RepID=UPI0019D1EAE6|nr:MULTISPECIES: LysR substrate-binding domain-containing protein [Sphingobium]MBR2267853.1 LysR family transcriptional regulator [Sphingobium sp.]